MGNEFKPHLAIVDDEPHFSESLQMALEDAYEVSKVHSLAGARRFLLNGGAPDVILLDIRLPDGSGIDFLRELKNLKPMPVVIVMTAHATVDNAVSALKEGAVDYFTKPLDIEKLKREIDVYLENRALQRELADLSRKIKNIVPPFVTSGTGKMRALVERVKMIAPLNMPVLVTGETGTGKEKLAGWIHCLSGLEGEMVAINCSALPKDIFENELFGHVKGAFSGAVSNKEGLIERAESGTLFLDEIGELPEPVQAKLLRVLEDGVYYKIGDTKERRVRFRLISATSKNISGISSKFRADLFYRINGFTFELPPLRERNEDIPLLVSAFIKEANGSYKKSVTGVSPDVMELLMGHGWPGNIRQLKWLVHRAVAITPGEILGMDEVMASSGISDIPVDKETDYSTPFQKAMMELEKKYISNAIVSTGNKTEAAKLLGISVRVLHYKVKKYGL
ncbi:MAG: sigma-54 dependent transcriptional regulator [Nitrospiraceae bacterium]|nr:sigma-54 dependent transcriptional regulator [Nitrospiraceae bacterium]